MGREIAGWAWSGEGPARLWAELTHTGAARLQLGALAERARLDPWGFVEQLLGVRPLMLERQPIRPVAGGRSFASSGGPAPFHTDSQLFAGGPPTLQLMLCVRQAGHGGESLFLDTWPLLDRLARSAPGLYEWLFTAPRRLPFVFGEVLGPTVSWRAESLVFTHPAQPTPEPEARALLDELSREAHYECRAVPGELLVIHNHRLLHGRRAFADAQREFVRLLVWTPPLPSPAPHADKARALSRRDAQTRDLPRETRRRLGALPPPPEEGARRAAVVLEMLRGVPPGVLAAREGVHEVTLYRWRDESFYAMAEALSRRDDD